MENKTIKNGLYSTIVAITMPLLLFVCGGGGGDDSMIGRFWVNTDVVVSDIDLDGRNDVLTLAMFSKSKSNREGRLKVYRQVDQGEFLAPSTYIVGEYPWQMVVRDIDGDVLPDLLVTDTDLGGVWLLLQDPNHIGQFLSPRQLTSDTSAYHTAIADFNNDNTSDIAISNDCEGRIIMLYQDPMDQGMFLPAIDLMIPGSSASSELTAGDLDGDSLDDLVAWIYLISSGHTPNGVLAISFQQPNSTLGPITTLASQTGLNVENLTIDDYNGDGLGDLFVFFTPWSSGYNAKLTVVLQESLPGSFAEPVDTTLPGMNALDDAVVADLNGDGRPDFAVVGSDPEDSSSRLRLFMQSGDGAFSLEKAYKMPISSAKRITAGNIDDDGLIDLVVLGGDKNRCWVLIQSHSITGTFDPPSRL